MYGMQTTYGMQVMHETSLSVTVLSVLDAQLSLRRRSQPVCDDSCSVRTMAGSAWVPAECPG